MKRDLEKGQLKSNYDLDVTMHQLIINTCDNSQIKKIYLITGTSLGSSLRLITINRIALSSPLKRNLKNVEGALIPYLSSSMDKMFGTIAASYATGELVDRS
jgi:hypothetical protein